MVSYPLSSLWNDNPAEIETWIGRTWREGSGRKGRTARTERIGTGEGVVCTAWEVSQGEELLSYVSRLPIRL